MDCRFYYRLDQCSQAVKTFGLPFGSNMFCDKTSRSLFFLRFLMNIEHSVVFDFTTWTEINYVERLRQIEHRDGMT